MRSGDKSVKSSGSRSVKSGDRSVRSLGQSSTGTARNRTGLRQRRRRSSLLRGGNLDGESLGRGGLAARDSLRTVTSYDSSDWQSPTYSHAGRSRYPGSPIHRESSWPLHGQRVYGSMVSGISEEDESEIQRSHSSRTKISFSSFNKFVNNQCTIYYIFK